MYMCDTSCGCGCVWRAVLDVDYSPSGAELVSGGYDKVLRIFDVERIHSRCVQ